MRITNSARKPQESNVEKAQFSNHLKILLTKPTTNIQEAKLVERPRHVRRSVRKREVGVV